MTKRKWPVFITKNLGPDDDDTIRETLRKPPRRRQARSRKDLDARYESVT
ncbi:hypothetical protein ACFQU1_23380 [Chelatococcus sp. GCM10030263]